MLNRALFELDRKVKNALADANKKYERLHLKLLKLLDIVDENIHAWESKAQYQEVDRLLAFHGIVCSIPGYFVGVGVEGAAVATKLVIGVTGFIPGGSEMAANACQVISFKNAAAEWMRKARKPYEPMENIRVQAANQAMADELIEDMTSRVNALKLFLPKECETQADCEPGIKAVEDLAREMENTQMPDFKVNPLTADEMGALLAIKAFGNPFRN
jgi:hypothetical protein